MKRRGASNTAAPPQCNQKGYALLLDPRLSNIPYVSFLSFGLEPNRTAKEYGKTFFCFWGRSIRYEIPQTSIPSEIQLCDYKSSQRFTAKSGTHNFKIILNILGILDFQTLCFGDFEISKSFKTSLNILEFPKCSNMSLNSFVFLQKRPYMFLEILIFLNCSYLFGKF